MTSPFAIVAARVWSVAIASKAPKHGISRNLSPDFAGDLRKMFRVVILVVLFPVFFIVFRKRCFVQSSISVSTTDFGRAFETRIFNSFSSVEVPALPAARAGESFTGRDAGVRELQPQAEVRAQKPGAGGVKSGPNSRTEKKQ